MPVLLQQGHRQDPVQAHGHHRQAVPRTGESQGPAALARPGGAVHPARRPAGLPRPRDGVRQHGRHPAGLRGGTRPRRRRRPGDRGGPDRMVHRGLAPRNRGHLGGRRRPDGGRTRRVHAQDPGGTDHRGDRQPRGLQPGRGQGSHPDPRRQGGRIGVEEHQLRGGGRERRHQAGQGRSSSACRSWTRTASVRCWQTARRTQRRGSGIAAADAAGDARADAEEDHQEAWPNELPHRRVRKRPAAALLELARRPRRRVRRSWPAGTRPRWTSATRAIPGTG